MADNHVRNFLLDSVLGRFPLTNSQTLALPNSSTSPGTLEPLFLNSLIALFLLNSLLSSRTLVP